MSRRRGYKRYSAEFKREALNRSSEDRMTDKVLCEELGISGGHVSLSDDAGLILAFAVVMKA